MIGYLNGKRVSMTNNSLMLNSTMENKLKFIPGAFNNLNLFKIDLLNVISSIKDKTLVRKMKKLAVTNKPYEINEILSVDMIAGFITSGDDSVNKVLLPLVTSFYEDTHPKSEKGKKIMTGKLKAGYKEALRIHKSEYDEEMKKKSKDGIYSFESQIEQIIYPYSIFK